MAPKLLIPVRVDDIRDLAADVRAIDLVPSRRPDLPGYRAGAHTIVQLDDGLRRSYSLCGDPADPGRYRIAVKLDHHGRGGSLRMHQLRVGDELLTTYPQSGFGLAEGYRRHIFIAGGIGITPIYSMLSELTPLDTVECHYAARSPQSAPFLEEVTTLLPDVQTYFSSQGQRVDVTDVLAEVGPATAVYCCGPPSLMATTISAMEHWPAGSLHIERFEGLSPQQAHRGAAFTVELTLSAPGRVIQVPHDQSLLQVLLAQAIPIPSSCEGGVCGSCLVAVKDGSVIHRDLCMSPGDQAHSMTACVSRADGHLRLLA